MEAIKRYLYHHTLHKYVILAILVLVHGGMVNYGHPPTMTGSLKNKDGFGPHIRIKMVIKDLDLEPKIDAIMRDFLDLSWWKELSKEMSSKILPGGDRQEDVQANC
nr:hypothetical protein [Tanacetum cinerariifolium]